jgi:DNA topoisomerase-2
LPKHIIKFKYETAEDEQLIDMAFSKGKADDRKRWIESYVPTDQVDFNQKILTYKDFVNKELVHFSIASNARAIPHVMDGLKPGQRKILYSCFKRNLVNDIKVAQLSGYVAEHSAYHHGEASLNQTIIGMAQDFVGSNNINLLEPLGQFGSRNGGGREAASPRYVFTKLTPLARVLFPALDDNLLNYLEDDGCNVEPDFYVPVVPFALVNGCNGIGTGWSTSIPSFNPEDIVNNLRRLMNGTPMEEMLPWFYGFTGTVQANATTGYTINGNYKFLNEETAEITELPIGTWTSDYKEFLESLMTGDKASQKISHIREMHSRSSIHFLVNFKNGYLDEIRSTFEKKMKLTSNFSKNNMILFDEENKIHRYEDPREIIKAFYPIRLELYRKRKLYLLERLGGELRVLENKVRFIKEIISGQLVINQLKRSEVIKLLGDKGYHSLVQPKGEKDEEEAQEEESTGSEKKDYNYLLGMKLWNLTYEKVEHMVAEHLKKDAEVKKIQATSELEMWNTDLDNFLQVYKQEVKLI